MLSFLDQQQYKQLEIQECKAQSSCGRSLFVWLEKEKEVKKETFHSNFQTECSTGKSITVEKATW